MADLKNFENQDQKTHFYLILKNGIQSFLSIGLLVFGGMWLLGVVGNTTHHFACDAENTVKKSRLNYFIQDGNYF